MIEIKVLVTGNLGYIGSVLTSYLVKRDCEIIGLDNGFFKDYAYVPRSKVDKQIIKDIRNVEKDDIKGIYGIVHLAAISNDPLGELNPQITYDVNHKASIKLAKLAKDRKAGFVIEMDKEIHKYVYLGIGYNFTDFTDKLEEYDDDYKVSGFFIRITAKY